MNTSDWVSAILTGLSVALAWLGIAVILFIALPIGIGKFLARQDRKRVASAKDWEAYVNRWSDN